MAGNYDVTTKFKVDISDLQSSMQQAKRQISLATAEFKAATASMDNWSKSADGISAKLTQLDKTLNSQKSILSDLERQYELTVKQFGAGSKEAENLKIKIENQKAAIGKTEKEIRNYNKSLDDLESGADDAGDGVEDLSKKTKEAGKSADEASDGFTVMKGALADLVADGIQKATEALAGFIKEAIAVGSSFEASMSEVAAISGATGDDFKLLEDTAKKFGATTMFSASESAQALKYMALAGWDAQTASDALGGVLALASASGMDLAKASDMVTDYLSAFGMEAEKSTYFADMLAYSQSKSNTSAEQLGEAYKNCAANLNAAGQDVETVTSLLAMMANQGFKGSEAGTALTAIMRDMTAKMKDGKIAIGDTNIEVMDANGNYRDLTEVLKEVEKATDGMGDAERAMALSTTFTADSTKGLNLLLNAGIGTAEDFEKALRGAGGTAEDMGDVMTDNLAGDVKEAQSALEDLYITAYDELKPTLREIVQYVTSNVIPVIKNDVLPAVKDFINTIVKNKDTILAAVTAIGTAFVAWNVVSMVSGVISVVKKLSTELQAGKTIMQALNLTLNANPIGLIVTAIAALVAGFITLWNTSDEFREFWIGLWEKLKEIVGAVIDAIVGFFTGLWDSITNIFNTIVEFVKENWQAMLLFLVNPIAGIFKYLYDNFEGFRDVVDNVVEAIKGFFAGLWDKIVAIFTPVVEWYSKLFNSVADTLKSIVDVIVDLLKGCWEIIKAVFKVVADWFKTTVIEPVAKFFTELWEKISKLASDAWNGIKKVFKSVGNWFNTTVIEPVANFFTGMWDKLKTGASNAWDGIKKVFSKVVDFFKDTFEKAWTAVKNVFSVGGKIFDGIKDGIVSAFTTVVNAIIRGINKVVSIPFNAINSVLDTLRNLEILGLSPFDWIGSIAVPQIPELAKGGVLKKGQVGFLEGNGDEAVVPLDHNTGWLDEVASRIVDKARLIGGQTQTVNNNYNYEFNQTNNSPKPLSRLEIYRQSKNLLGYVGGV